MSGLTKDAFQALWDRFDREAQEHKFSQEAFLRLKAFYRQLDDDDRLVVNGVLPEWISQGDLRHRYDALALIEDFGIRSVLPTLKVERARLATADGPSVPFDRKELARIIAELERT